MSIIMFQESLFTFCGLSLFYGFICNFCFLLGQATGINDSRIQDLAVEKGTIHTKRHSGEDPLKTGYVHKPKKILTN